MAKKEILINAQDINRVIVTATFEIDVQDNLDQAMAAVREILDGILTKAEMDQDAIDIAIEATIRDKKEKK
jgi:hypothetical protein